MRGGSNYGAILAPTGQTVALAPFTQFLIYSESSTLCLFVIALYDSEYFLYLNFEALYEQSTMVEHHIQNLTFAYYTSIISFSLSAMT